MGWGGSHSPLQSSFFSVSGLGAGAASALRVGFELGVSNVVVGFRGLGI